MDLFKFIYMHMYNNIDANYPEYLLADPIYDKIEIIRPELEVNEIKACQLTILYILSLNVLKE